MFSLTKKKKEVYSGPVKRRYRVVVLSRNVVLRRKGKEGKL